MKWGKSCNLIKKLLSPYFPKASIPEQSFSFLSRFPIYPPLAQILAIRPQTPFCWDFSRFSRVCILVHYNEQKLIVQLQLCSWRFLVEGIANQVDIRRASLLLLFCWVWPMWETSRRSRARGECDVYLPSSALQSMHPLSTWQWPHSLPLCCEPRHIASDLAGFPNIGSHLCR